MLYLAIDQHRNQLTVNLRGENGDILLRRQVSTQWEKVRDFFEDLRMRAQSEGGFVTILEVCGFNYWLLQMLAEYGCRLTIVVQPEMQSKQKTDRRDANSLGELLWVNRQRFAAGKSVQGVRQVHLPGQQDADARQLTELRSRLVATRTRTLNRLRHILNKHNLHHSMPTKGLQTKGCVRWLTTLELPSVDRLELDLLLEQWRQIDEQLAKVDAQVRQAADNHELVRRFRSVPGAGSFIALVLACRLADGLSRFESGQAVANYWGLTPGCRNSGQAKERLGSITKAGSRLARLALSQLVLHVLRRDAWMRTWYQRIKKRRGSKIARVAVMRRLAVIFWKLGTTNTAYVCGGPNAVQILASRSN